MTKQQTYSTWYNEVYTPECAVIPLAKFLEEHSLLYDDDIISEPCQRSDSELSAITRVFQKTNTVFETGIHNFKPLSILNNKFEGIDWIITNPPYSKPIGDKIIQYLFETGKPFAILLYGSRLFGVNRHKLYQKYNPTFLLFDNRIDFTGKTSPPNDNFWLLGNTCISEYGNDIYYLKQMKE